MASDLLGSVLWTNLRHLDHLDHLGRGRCRGPSRACGAPRGAQMALAAPAPLPAAGAAPRSRVVITEELRRETSRPATRPGCLQRRVSSTFAAAACSFQGSQRPCT